MCTIPSDPLAALVHLRVEQLRRDAGAERLARLARDRRTGRRRAADWTWPTSVVTALRDSLAGGSPRLAGLPPSASRTPGSSAHCCA